MIVPICRNETDQRVLTLLSDGYLLKEIAAQLNVCNQSIAARLTRMKARADSDTTAQLVKRAVLRGEVK